MFDTAKSTLVAIARDKQHDEGSEIRFKDVPYRTPKGAFFIHEYSQRFFRDGNWSVLVDEAYDVSPEQAVKWIEDTRAMVKDTQGLPLPEEA